METRALTALDRRIAVIGTGTWQLGLDQGEVAPETAAAALEAAVDAGVTLIDTADVYGDGRSERFVGRFLAAHPDAGLTIATKMGRRAAHTPGRASWRGTTAPAPTSGSRPSTSSSCTARPARSSRRPAPGSGSTRWSRPAASAPTA